MKHWIILTGHYGGGKTTFGSFLEKLGVSKCVTYTTRLPLNGEIEGKSHHFVSQSYIDSLSEQDILDKTVYAGNTYLTLKEDVKKAFDKSDFVYSILDYRGLLNIKKLTQNITEVKITAIVIDCSLDKAIERLQNSNLDTTLLLNRLAFSSKIGEDTYKFNLGDDFNYVIHNDYSLEALNEQAINLMESFVEEVNYEK